MAGLLDGQLASQVYAAFRNKLQKGTLWRAGIAQSAGLDALGDPMATDPASWPMQGFREDYSAIYRAQAGIPETDSKINIFAKSLPGGIAPLRDDKAFLAGQWWQLRKVGTDPATALWVCQSFVCAAPP